VPKAKLTKRSVDALKPDEKAYTAWDTDLVGFGLRVRPSGERTYVLKYRIGREQAWFTIGRHGSPWTAEQARAEARKLLGDVARGVNPAAKRDADRAAINFAELCDLYMSEGVAHKKPSTLKSDRGRIELHLKPKLGRKRLDLLGRDDIERLLAEVKTGKVNPAAGARRGRGSLPAGGSGVAGQCVALASAILQFAVERKLRADNPARGVRKPPVRKMQRFLSPAELGRLADALTASLAAGGNPFATAAIRLLALTGARRSEILTLRWRNVDLERGLLLLDDSKTREKAIHLSPPAVEILARLPRIDDNEFVIAGGKPGAPYVGLSNFWQDVKAPAPKLAYVWRKSWSRTSRNPASTLRWGCQSLASC
jgi:integrase